MKLSPDNKPFRISLGDRGEMAGWDYLRRSGYRLLEKNFRSRRGEIDVIAEKNGRICFIEIKTRTGEGFGLPEEAVDLRKQRKLVDLAAWYLREKKISGRGISFGVLAIGWKASGDPEMRLIENASGDDARSWSL